MKAPLPTIYPRLNHVLTQLTEKIQTVLSQDFVGAYLQGSFAIGDFDTQSDVDLIIVVERELSASQVEQVQSIHTSIYKLNNRWAKRLEYSYFPKKLVKRVKLPIYYHMPRNLLWYFDNGSPQIAQSTHCNTVVVRWTLREKGVVLAGSHPSTFIDPIPTEILRTDIYETLVGWGKEILEKPEVFQNRFYQSYLVLNYSRMLCDLHLGEAGSKLRGINWAKKMLDDAWIPLIDFCWEERKDPGISIHQEAETEVYPKVLEFVEYIMDKAKV